MSRPFQQRFVEHDLPAAWAQGHKRVILALPPGSGKCLGPDEPVLLYNGRIKRAADVVVGDQLMGPDGPRHVLSTTMGLGPLFKIVPVKGRSWICNDVHVLTVVDTDTNEVFDIPLNEFLKQSKWFRERKKLFIPSVVHFAPIADPIVDPYFMGVWFGDGYKAPHREIVPHVVITKPDPEIKALCDEIAAQWGLRAHTRAHPTCPIHSIVGKSGTFTNPLLNAIRMLVGPERSIPDCIRLGSPEVRRAFLAGMLDTDGHYYHGHFEIVQARKDYADVVVFIARSLGIRVHETEKVVKGSVYYRMSLSGDFMQLPLRIPRKKPQPRLQIKDAKRTGFTVEPLGIGSYAGFELDGDGRFLLGDFTVTHNTRCSRLVTERLLSVGGWDCWFLAHRKELIEQAAMDLRHLDPVLVLPGKSTPAPAVLRIAGRDTLARREIVPLHTQALVISDEYHHGTCDTHTRLLDRLCAVYSVVYVLGLTATPYTLSGKPIPGDVIIEPVTPAELFESGAILEPEVIGAAAPELGGVPLIGGDFAVPEIEARSRKLMGDMIKEIDKWSDGYPVIVRACSIADSKARVERLRAAGYRAEHLDGATPAGQRDEILARLAIGGKRGAAGGIDVLSQVGIVGEGWNNPSDYERVLRMPYLWGGKSYPPPFVPVSLLSDCAPTMSMCLYRQAECRINRPNNATLHTSQGLMEAIPKAFARVVSHSGNWQRHGFLRDHHSFELQTGEVRGMGSRDKHGLLTARYCSVCLSVWPASRTHCACGAALTQPRRPIEEDETEELKPINPKAGIAEASENARLAYLANLWRQWKRDNEKRAAVGKNPISTNQPAVIYKNQTGRWPTKADLEKARAMAGA